MGLFYERVRGVGAWDCSQFALALKRFRDWFHTWLSRVIPRTQGSRKEFLEKKDSLYFCEN
jgi:hypothetical protein